MDRESISSTCRDPCLCWRGSIKGYKDAVRVPVIALVDLPAHVSLDIFDRDSELSGEHSASAVSLKSMTHKFFS